MRFINLIVHLKLFVSGNEGFAYQIGHNLIKWVLKMGKGWEVKATNDSPLRFVRYVTLGKTVKRPSLKVTGTEKPVVITTTG